jgi:hypothetical protein
MRRLLTATCLSLAFLAAPAYAQLSINYGGPGVSIGLNLGGYPNLVPVPGYPVYYAPGVDGNYFYYDGLYWVYQGDNWYESSWYNGPWTLVDPFEVPTFILQVPVRYYHRAPAYFRGWNANGAPHWAEHWGRNWSDRRQGWDHRVARAPAPAPLPTYQRQYSGNRYPSGREQSVIHAQNNHYQPRESISRGQFQYHQNEARRVNPQNGAPYRTPTTPRGQERNGGTGQDQRG